MDAHFPPQTTCASAFLPEKRTLLSTALALLDIARLEIDKDPCVAAASIARACALLRAEIDRTTALGDTIV
jgi:hypothetical protein